ncbi:MAG: hypothetical protein IJL19_06020 [Clostridiales bacterium]|nr:hypothetical protein [Clostridiales bacterium]
MKKEHINELSLEELENVAGGTELQWHCIDCIFRGGDLFADANVGFFERIEIKKLIMERTGFILRYGEVNSEGEKELIYESPEGEIYAHDDFMDYLRAYYPISYLSGGIWPDA